MWLYIVSTNSIFCWPFFLLCWVLRNWLNVSAKNLPWNECRMAQCHELNHSFSVCCVALGHWTPRIWLTKMKENQFSQVSQNHNQLIKSEITNQVDTVWYIRICDFFRMSFWVIRVPNNKYLMKVQLQKGIICRCKQNGAVKIKTAKLTNYVGDEKWKVKPKHTQTH